MACWMTDDQIRTSHRDAADKEKQVKILAQLNAVDPEVIRAILRGETANRSDGETDRRIKWKPSDDRMLLALWSEGMRAKDIAAEMGRTQTAVNQRINNLRKRGMNLEKYGGYKARAERKAGGQADRNS